jgi:hypothetical protein
MKAQEVGIKLLNAWKKDPPPSLSSNELHALYFLDDVCAYLGVAATDANKVQCRTAYGKAWPCIV